MRCFPDRVIVLFPDVVMDLYMLTVASGLLSRNDVTSL